MFKLVGVLLLLLCTLSRADDLARVTGEWLPAITFPNTVMVPLCNKYNLTDAHKTSRCTCGDTTKDLPVITFSTKDVRLQNFAVSVVENANEVQGLLDARCDCAGTGGHIVLRSLDEDHLMQYELQTTTRYTQQELNTANLLIKKVPTLKQLIEYALHVQDIKDRDAGLLCPTDFFPKN